MYYSSCKPLLLCFRPGRLNYQNIWKLLNPNLTFFPPGINVKTSLVNVSDTITDRTASGWHHHTSRAVWAPHSRPKCDQMHQTLAPQTTFKPRQRDLCPPSNKQTIRLMALTYLPAGGPAITLCFNSPSFRVSHFIFPGTGRLHGDA